MPTCAEGHTSAAADYCDVCGSPITEAPGSTEHSAQQSLSTCPACGKPINGRFCEACGHDSALPTPPRSEPRTPTWTAVVAADRDFYDRIVAQGGPDSVEFPEVFPERRVVLRRDTNLIGRRNRDQGVQPQIDLAIHPADRGVSTQHAVLRVTDSGVTITDLGSTNGTSLNDSDDYLSNGEETPLADGDRIHLGAWTTITIRQE